MQTFSPRIFRIHGSDFWADEVLLAPRTHTDERLAAVKAMGFDGVWLHAELRLLAPTELMAEFEPCWAQRLDALRTVIDRAVGHGIGIWLYLNEPRGYPVWHPFWQKHPDMRGQEFRAGTHLGGRWGAKREPSYAMCLSVPPVIDFLRESMRQVLVAAPKLAGCIVITESEFHTHCYSRVYVGRQKIQCPRCAGRAPAEMPVAIAQAMDAGKQEADSEATLAFWTWAWDRHAGDPPHAWIVERLPAGAPLLSDFERGVAATRSGRPMTIDEYSLAVAGPSPPFVAYAQEAKRTQRPIWAKLQINTTHELATVPNIPVPGLLYEKILAARRAGVHGVMATWTMGLRPTLNTYAVGQLMTADAAAPMLQSRDTFLCWLAPAYFGQSLTGEQVEQLVRSWERFADAMSCYPTIVPLLYNGPMNYAPAFPWKLHRDGTRMARSWTAEPWGDKLEMSLGTFSLAEMGAMLDQVASQWEQAMPDCRLALAPLVGDNTHAREELNSAEACGLFFRSSAGVYQFASAVERSAPGNELQRLIAREQATCEQVIALLESDPRIGWHDDLQRQMCSADAVRQKLVGLHELCGQIASSE